MRRTYTENRRLKMMPKFDIMVPKNNKRSSKRPERE